MKKQTLVIGMLMALSTAGSAMADSAPTPGNVASAASVTASVQARSRHPKSRNRRVRSHKHRPAPKRGSDRTAAPASRSRR